MGTARVDHRKAERSVTWAGLVHLLVVYVVWGSTYLAIRVGVREGAGFPPFTFGALRVVVAGVLLLLWAGWAGARIKPNKKELWTLAVSGLLLWTGGNGMVIWAEHNIHSAYAALLVSSTPMWAAVVEAIVDRVAPSALLILSLTIGFLGTALLSVPILRSGTSADLLSVFGLLFASLSWSSGSIFQNRHPVGLGVRASSAYQQLFGSAGFIVLALILNEPTPRPTAEAWYAWGYLVVIGSIFAFTSFVQALRLLPTGIVFTYAYVNPVIAVFLGWLVLSEPVTVWTLGGASLVLLGVAGVFREKGSARRQARRPDTGDDK